MLYYKKQNMIFYKLDEVQKNFLEIFESASQTRLMSVEGQKQYDELLERIQTSGFETCTTEEFEERLISVKSKF